MNLLPEKNLKNYEAFLEARLRSGEIESLSLPQKEKLIAAFDSFKLCKKLTTKFDEVIEFSPFAEQTVEDYIHHFLIKFNKGIDWYSDTYLELLGEIENTIINHDERILLFQKGSDRICYVRVYKSDSKRPYHVFVAHITNEQKIIGWTHFNAKAAYINTLRKEEEKLVKERGIIDKNEIKMDVDNYKEYLILKRKTLLYLGSSALISGNRP